MASPPVDIPWPVSTAPGERPQESSGRLINAFSGPTQNEGKFKVLWKRMPGITQFCNTDETGYRGALPVLSTLYVGVNEKLISINAAGTKSLVGTLSGENPITLAHNNVQPIPQLGIVTENGAFLLDAGLIIPWPDADLPQPNSISFQDGFFFFTVGDKRVFASEINSTGINSQTFTTCQSRSGGTLLRGIPFNGLMYFFCSTFTEVYQNAAASQAAPRFPYARLTVLDRGLLSAHAIAGFEPGFGSLLYVSDDYGVYRASSNGLVMEKVSPPFLDALIRKVPDKSKLRAGCFVADGRRWWTIDSETWSWGFNLNTEKWSEMWSVDGGAISTLRRGIGGVLAFDKWLLGSRNTGDVVYIDPSNFFEESNPQVWRMESGPVETFPKGVRVGRADFYFSTGVGIPNGIASQQNPQVAISWSDDGGMHWSYPVLRQLGQQMQFQHVAVVAPGRTTAVGRRWRIEVTDAVYVGFLGATMSVASTRGP